MGSESRIEQTATGQAQMFEVRRDRDLLLRRLNRELAAATRDVTEPRTPRCGDAMEIPILR